MNIKVETTDKALSSRAGILVFGNMFNWLGLQGQLASILPRNKISVAASPVNKFRALTLGMVAGADCLDDMERLALDPGFAQVCEGRLSAANTYGDFLRGFSHYKCKQLNDVLTDMALKVRKKIAPKKADFILDIDSTTNPQTGRKIEGARYNYEGTWGLDSLVAFDQYGLQYHMDVREGATFTANGAPEAIHRIFSRVDRRIRKWGRADSGYCNVACFNAFSMADVGFVIAMRNNILQPLLPRIHNWRRAKKIKFKGDRNCEVGHTLHYPQGGTKALRVVVLRSRRDANGGNALFQDAKYEYQGFISSIGHHEMSNEALIEFYRNRGNAENYIRELKNGYDLRHFPCQKLVANKVYALIGAMAHNLMRYMAHLLNPKNPTYAKVTRFLAVNLPCQVVRHARGVSFKMNQVYGKEVRSWIEHIQTQFGYG